jgi:hypothetical protein
MANISYDASFASVLPIQRDREAILVDLQPGAPAGASDATRAKLAEIELHIQDGDRHYRARRYQPALDAFKKARALIYRLLQPAFDPDSYVRAPKDVPLPTAAALERGLIEVAVRVTDSLRPVAPEPDPIWRAGREPIPEGLREHASTGFREPIGAEDTLGRANAQAVSLLNESKPEGAISVLQDALQRAAADGRPDPSYVAATHLNIAAAYLQLDVADRAATHADASLKFFQEAKDSVGAAQALHLAGISAHKAGDEARARELLPRAAETLKLGEVRAAPATEIALVAVGGAAPRPTASPIALETPSRAAPALAVVSRLGRDAKDLQAIANQDTQRFTFRVPGRAEGWGSMGFVEPQLKRVQGKEWAVGIPAGEKVVALPAGGGRLPASDRIVSELYVARQAARSFKDLRWRIVDPSTTSAYLAHLYGYVLPVKIGDCYNELGQYAKAEEYYLIAAGYTYLNRNVEATALWIRLARNAVEWGDALYKAEDFPAAKAQYGKLITDTGEIPASFLYSNAALAVPAGEARTLIQNLLARPLPAVNWEIAMWVLTASARLQQLLQGLDFYGLLLSPIHTFEYLQNVARGFAQEAIQAEREFVTFKNHEELEAATRRDLETTKAMAHAEADGRYQQYRAAQEDEQAANRALQLSIKRRNDAVSQRNAYAASSSAQIWAQAAAAALSGGEDAMWGEISELADRLDRGETIEGPRPKLAAAQILRAGRKTREYELKKMQDTIDELTQAIGVAQDQVDAAARRRAAAEIAWQAALQRAQMADAALEAFDDEFFTPESWGKMADVMRGIARDYLFRAIRIAKLMERAYNFENDAELRIIKNEYGHNVANPAAGEDTRLLGGDSLMKDIESFTYHAITTKTRKSSRIKDVISIASDFPAHFEAFRESGLLSVETDLYEFDRLHPGFYGQRLEAVELEVIGLLPEGGLNGTLTAGGVTAYRKKDGTAGKRVHVVDTMALSDFALRNDVFLYTAETGVRGLFQGLGVGSTWQLHLPKRGNDFDFRRIFDVHLVLYYTAKYDAALRTAVLARPPRPGELALLRNFGLRYDFPDAWYGFYRGGAADFTIDRFRLPQNQQDFSIRAAHFRVVTKAGVSSQGIGVRVTGPNGAIGTAQTDANGVVTTGDPQLSGIVGADPLGAWKVEVIGGAPLMDAGTLKLDRVYNVQLGLEYGFTYVPEVV